MGKTTKAGLFLVSFVGGALTSQPAHATGYTINTNAMTQAWDGACSFLEALNAANTLTADHECPAGTGTDEINLGGGTYQVTTQLPVSHTLVINGSGTPYTILSARYGTTQYDTMVVVDGNLTINNLTLQNDTNNATIYTTGIVVWDQGSIRSADGLRVTRFTAGGIYVQNADFDLDHARIDRNVNRYPNSAWNHGGGIFINDFDGEPHGFALKNSSVTFNSADGNGGGLYFGVSGNSIVSYTTFANNSAASGGGIYVNTQTPGYFLASHLSIGRNSATVSGGGLYDDHQASGFRIESSVISNNTAPTAANVLSTVTYGIYFDNIFGSGVTSAYLDCNTDKCVHNTFGADGKFGPAMPMGGAYYSMEVLPLLKGSPAVDFNVVNGNEPVDQRGAPGNQDGDNNGSAGVDAGAFEKNLVWESEAELQYFTSSNDLVNIDIGSGYSGGLGRRLDANGTNDFVKYVVPIPEAGTYDITIKVKRASNGGKFFVGTATSLNGTYTEFPTEQTCYSASTSFPAAISLGTRTFSAAQNYYIRLRVSNPGTGGGRILYQDHLKVRKTN